MSRQSKETARRERARQLFKRLMNNLASAPFYVGDESKSGVTLCIEEIEKELEKEARLARLS